MEGEILRDDQWEKLRGFFPGGRKGKRGPRSDARRFFNALLWLARSGVICQKIFLVLIRQSNGAIIAGLRLASLIGYSRLWPRIPIWNG